MAIVSYFLWGFFPIYWRLLSDRFPIEILSHRLIWAGLFYSLLAFLVLKVKWSQILQSSKREWMLSLGATLILTLNWGLYIYAVNSGRIVEGSLAYFINPLMNVVVGVLLFDEKLSRSMRIAISLAAVGVIAKLFVVGEPPYLALTLATSFCIYGILKKKSRIPASQSSFQEGAIGAVLGFLILGVFSNVKHVEPIPYSTFFLFVGSGVVTGLPLYLFSYAAQRVPYSLMGLFQFIAPSLQLMVGVLIFKEPFPLAQQITFGFIWVGVIFYCVDRVNTWNKARLEQRRLAQGLMPEKFADPA